MEENVTKTHVKNTIQKFASGQKEKKDAREVIVTIFMIIYRREKKTKTKEIKPTR